MESEIRLFAVVWFRTEPLSFLRLISLELGYTLRARYLELLQTSGDGMRRKAAYLTGLVSVGVCLAGLAASSAAFAADAGGKQVANLRRLTEGEYRNSISDIFGNDIDIKGRFEPGRREGGLLAASSTILSITPAGFEAFSQMADSIAGQVVGPKHRDKLVGCTPKNAANADDACAGQFLSRYGRLLFRRPLNHDELASRVKLAGKLANSAHDFYAGLGNALAALLTAPDFLFREEVAVPASGKKYTLDGYSRAARLSYLLWDTTPDANLLHAAQSGELDTASGVERQVDRLMASPRLETGMRAFFADMLQLDVYDNTTKDLVIYPKYNAKVAAAAQEETLRTVIDLALKSNDDIRNLMTTQKTYVNRVLASIYDVPFNFQGEWMPYRFQPSNGRSGIVTQVSMLEMFSHPGRSSPTERGVAIMDIFLCEPTPLPPANVDFSIVNNTSGPLKTVRQRLLAHATNPTCASCHNHSDPIGLTLEDFDSLGAHRLRENGELIDVSGTIKDKTFIGGAGLGHYLHDNPKFPACLARKLYSYGVGANSEDVDPSIFKTAYKAFVDSGYRLRTLLKVMTTSPDYFDFTPPAPADTKTAMN
jgi:hypothetical protein